MKENPTTKETKEISWVVKALSIFFFSGAWIEALLDP